MPQDPRPRSFQQTLGDIEDAFQSRTGVASLRVAGPLLSTFEGCAQSTTRATQDVFSALNSTDPARLVGEQLDRYGLSRGVRRPQAKVATTLLTIGDSTFEKISSPLSPLRTPPIPGQTSLYVRDATDFTTSGSVYVGRGTAYFEGPLTYSAKVDNGSDWTLTLTSPIQRRHDGSEEVVLAQGGDRSVPASTAVESPQGNALRAARFQTVAAATIPDGEVSVSNVPAVCTQPGEVGNVPIGNLTSFPSAPFSGATVTNPSPVTNGQNIYKDGEYLELIRKEEAARSRGTKLAIERFAVGVTATDEPKTVLSASLTDRVAPEPAYLTIDDGTGYQPIDEGVASEVIVGAAVGGEQIFALTGNPIAKAKIISRNTPPWNFPDGATLAFEVAGTISEHTLNQSEYPSGIADPYAVAEDVNSHSSLTWEAVVLDNSQQVAFRAKSEFRDGIRSVTPPSGAEDAAETLGLENQPEETVFLYLNDQLLYKDGRPAVYYSAPFSEWAAISGSQTLEFSPDGAPTITATVVDQDFIDAGTEFTSVGRNSVSAWAAVLSTKLAGISVSISGSRLLLTSNLGASDRASIEISGGTLVGAGFFEAGETTGVGSDFTVDRSTSEIQLAEPLEEGDRLAAGSDQTRGFLESDLSGTISFADPATWWIAIDSEAVLRTLAVTPSSVYTPSTAADVVSIWGARLRLTVAAGAFTGLLRGDQVVFWDPLAPTELYGRWAVAQVASDGSWFELERIQAGWARSFAASTVLADGKIFVCGGYASPFSQTALRSAEVFDPATDTWTYAGMMAVPRAEHWAVTMASGDVLVGGGTSGGGLDPSYAGAVSQPEVWSSPNTFTPTTTTDAPTAAVGQAAAVIGVVAYAVGGRDATGTALDGTWGYDEGAGTWAVLDTMTDPRARHTLTALGGLLWAAGGEDGAVLDTVEQYDPIGDTWSAGGNLVVARQGHRASVTSGADILITGGSSGAFPSLVSRLASTERLVASTPPWIAGPVMATARHYHGQALLSGGDVLVAGGEAAAADAEVYDTVGNTWSNTDPPQTSPRQYVTAEPVGTDEAVLIFGAYSEFPTSTSERWDLGTGAWTSSNPVAGTTFSLTSDGGAYAYALDRLRKVQVPATANMTATALQDLVNEELEDGGAGSFVDRRQTTKLRWRSNTWGSALEVADGQPPGDACLITADINAQLADFPTGERKDNYSGQVAWVLSGNSEVGTPDFAAVRIIGSASSTEPALTWTHTTTEDLNSIFQRPSASHWLVGLGGKADSYLRTRIGQSLGHTSQFSGRELDGQTYGVKYYELRHGPEQGWWPNDRAYFAAPFAVGPNDDLVVVANRDEAQRRYAPNLFRRLDPVGTTYGQTCDYRDGDLSPVASLGTSFGIEYDFTDHAVFMRARGKSHGSDASRRVLWRWWRHGSEGEFANMAYAAPDGADEAVKVTVDDTSDDKTHVYVHLAGGALKTGAQIRPSTRLGVAAPSVGAFGADIVIACGLAVSAAQRATNVTTLTLTLPTGVTNHGIPNGSTIYFASTSVNFSSGLKVITSVAATTFTYADPGVDVGPDANPGTVSFDIGEALFTTFSPALAATDWVRINSLSSVSTNFEDRTSRLTSSGPQVIYARDAGFTAGATTTLAWGQLLDPDYLEVFVNPTETVTDIVAAAQALYDAGQSPIEPTITGTGAGTLYRSTDDEAGAQGTFYELYDGHNAIASQVAPGIPANNYSLTLKDEVEASIVSDSDWDNEDVRLVPVIASDLALWLQSSAVSGLYPGVRSEPASRGRRVQLWSATFGSEGAVQIQGGSGNAWGFPLLGDTEGANSSTALVCTADGVGETTGLVSGAWARIDLTTPAQRDRILSSTALSLLTSTGQLTVDGGSTELWREPLGSTFYQPNTSLLVERQGRFVRYEDAGFGSPTLDLTGVGEGDWVSIRTPATPTGGGVPEIASANAGLFRIVRATTSGEAPSGQCFWVELGAQEDAPPAECDLRFIRDGSILPGDTFTFGDTTWGAANQGEWVVSSLGDDGGGEWNDQRTINLDVSGRAPSPITTLTPLGTHYQLFRVVPTTPQRWFKRIRSLTPDPEGSGNVRVRLEGGAGAGIIGEALGATLTALDKLEFPTIGSQGRDAYHYHTGLVGEVNRVEFGSAEDPVTYPGVVAKGAVIRIDGPKIRRVFFAWAVRLKPGYTPADVKVAIQSATAGSVVKRAHGIPIPVSDLIREASRVIGVASVVPLSPYSSAQDLIPVQTGERALVLNPDRDVSVTFLGS